MKPDIVYLEEFNDTSRIHKLDFLRDALFLLQEEYNKQLQMHHWCMLKHINTRDKNKKQKIITNL